MEAVEEEKCLICGLILDDSTVIVKERGLLKFIESSIERNDGKVECFMDREEMKLHQTCRNTYNNPKCVIAEKKRKEKSLRKIERIEFDFQTRCLFCDSDASLEFQRSQKKYPESKRILVGQVKRLETQNSILQACTKHNDKWSKQVLLRIDKVNILEKNARYHYNCYTKFTQPYRATWVKRGLKFPKFKMTSPRGGTFPDRKRLAASSGQPSSSSGPSSSAFAAPGSLSQLHEESHDQLFESDPGSDSSGDHDEDLVEDPEAPAGIEDPLAQTFLEVKEEPIGEKGEPPGEQQEEQSMWEPPTAEGRRHSDRLDKDIHSDLTTFTCTECFCPSYGVTLTCLQCRDVQMCLRCDAEGRHSYHCLLKAPAMRHLDIVKSYLPVVRKKFISLLKDTMNVKEKTAMKADAKRKLQAQQKNCEVKKDVQTQPTSKEKAKSTKATSKNPSPKPIQKKAKPTTEIATQSKPSSTISSFLSSWSESLAEQDLISEDPQPALIPPMADLVFQTLEAPQLNVPIAMMASSSDLSSPSIAAGSHLGARAKRKADDLAGRKRQALDGDKVLVEISRAVEDEVMDVTEVKTEPPDDCNEPGDSSQGAFFVDYGSHRKPNV